MNTNIRSSFPVADQSYCHSIWLLLCFVIEYRSAIESIGLLFNDTILIFVCGNSEMSASEFH